MLRSFSAFLQRIDYKASWLHNLNSLYLGGVDNICEVFTVLSATHNLEYLEATSSEEAVPHVPRPVCLQNLRGLNLSLSFEEMAFTLEHLTIPPGCSLDLTTWPRYTDELWQEKFGHTLFQVMSSLSQVSRRYFRSHPSRILSIRCLEGGMEMCDDLRDGNVGHSPFKMLCQYFLPCPKSASDMYARFSFPEFASVTKLRLEYEVLTPSAPDLAFIRYLSSVETLHAYEQLFDHLTATQVHLSRTTGRRIILFPKLRRIVLRPMDTLNNARIPTRTVGKDTVKFILSRIENGYPISHIGGVGIQVCPKCKVLR